MSMSLVAAEGSVDLSHHGRKHNIRGVCESGQQEKSELAFHSRWSSWVRSGVHLKVASPVLKKAHVCCSDGSGSW